MAISVSLRLTLAAAGLVALAGCSVEVRPFPTLATAATSQELGVTGGRILAPAIAEELDRDGDGRLDMTAPLRFGQASFDDAARLELVVHDTTVCIDGPAGVVTAGPCG